MELRIERKMLKNPQRAVLTRGMQGKRRTEMYVLSVVSEQVQNALDHCQILDLMNCTYGFNFRDYIRFLHTLN